MNTHTITAVDQKLHHIVGEANGRYSLNAVHFNERFVAATNGHALAVRRKTSTVQHTNVVFKRANQTPSKRRDEHVEYASADDKSMSSTDGKNVATIIEGRFPQWEDSVPSGSTQKTTIVTIDAKLLYKLAQAICTEDNHYVTLEIGGPKDHVLVATSDNEAFGVIMPCSSDVVPQDVVNHVMKNNS